MILKHIYNRYRRVSINAVASFCQVIIVGICYFFLYKYLLKTLGVEELGLWSLIVASTSIASMGSLGIGGSIIKFVAAADANNDCKKITGIIHTSFITVLPVMTIICSILYLILPGILSHAVTTGLYSLALQLIPLALLNFFLSSVGGIFQSAIDGIQLIYVRNFIASCLIILYLILTFFLVPLYGLVGVVYAQIIQSLLTIICYLIVVTIKIPHFSFIKIQISKSIFKELFNYGINFQIISLSSIFFGPITKYFLSRYGGLNITGFYEMASKLVIQLRGLIVGSLNVIVPAIANIQAKGFANIKDLYVKWFPYLFTITIILITGIISMANYISAVWVGKVEIDFVFILSIISIGWFFNVISTYAYFIDLGTGDLKWNVIAHITQSLGNVGLCYLFGRMLGGYYTIFGPALALIIGTFILMIPFHKQFNLKTKDLMNPQQWQTISLCIICILVSFGCYFIFKNSISVPVIFFINVLLILGIFSIFYYKNRWYFLSLIKIKS